MVVDTYMYILMLVLPTLVSLSLITIASVNMNFATVLYLSMKLPSLPILVLGKSLVNPALLISLNIAIEMLILFFLLSNGTE